MRSGLSLVVRTSIGGADAPSESTGAAAITVPADTAIPTLVGTVQLPTAKNALHNPRYPIGDLIFMRASPLRESPRVCRAPGRPMDRAAPLGSHGTTAPPARGFPRPGMHGPTQPGPRRTAVANCRKLPPRADSQVKCVEKARFLEIASTARTTRRGNHAWVGPALRAALSWSRMVRLALLATRACDTSRPRAGGGLRHSHAGRRRTCSISSPQTPKTLVAEDEPVSRGRFAARKSARRLWHPRGLEPSWRCQGLPCTTESSRARASSIDS